MPRYAWRRVARNWLAGTATIEVSEGGRLVGRLKVIDRSGAVAETPHGPLSFRASGRIGHDAAVLRLSDERTIASLNVTPMHKKLSFENDGVYEWRPSFLLRRHRWLRSDEVVVTVKTNGEIEAAEDLPPFEASVLMFFGLYLMLSGRAG
jgi:hypothetical protein